MPTYTNDGSHTYNLGTPVRTLSPGDTGFATPLILDHLPGLTRTADTPRFNLLRARHELTLSGSAEATATLAEPQLVRVLLISATIDVDMFFGDILNTPGKRLLKDHDYFLVPNGLVEALVFGADIAGKVLVEEVGPLATDISLDGDSVLFGGEGVTFAGRGISW